jgi:hypothetical protein
MPRQVARLRALAGLFPLEEVARLMRRSYSSVKNATCKHGIDCDRAWTPGQLARLRADYGKLPSRQLAQVLGRLLPAVYRMARKLGLSRTASRFTAEDLARIRELNGQGWSDTEIAHTLGRDRHETTKHRKRLHLPSQQHGHRVRARLAAALQRQLERLGLHSAAEMRKHAHQDFARRFGLPEDLAPRAVLIVLHLLQKGVSTRRDVYEAVGASWRDGRGSLLCNATKTSYLGDLQRRDLVARIHRRSEGPDARRLPDLYLLTAEALDLLSAAAHPTEEGTDDDRER